MSAYRSWAAICLPNIPRKSDDEWKELRIKINTLYLLRSLDLVEGGKLFVDRLAHVARGQNDSDEWDQITTKVHNPISFLIRSP